jgi:GNAT superfamily N-acetyltransferase
VDRNHQRHGLGRALLRDAIFRTFQVAGTVGVAALLVQAISEEARVNYLSHGFLESPIAPMTLCLPLDIARRALLE